ncbi:MAG: hypothetical protein V3T27_02470 [Alphaproteobacteria bacterium]
MTMSAAVGVSRKPYKDWDAWWIERGALALVLVPQVGGRIMGMIWRGRDLAFTNAELEGRVENVAAVDDIRARKRELGFLLWGGDKTWLAPQGRWTENVPFIDLDSGAYELSVDSNNSIATMTSPVCRETGVQIERRVGLGNRTGTWRVTHTLRNESGGVVSWAPWIVTMLVRPASVFLPTRADSPYPQGVRTFKNEGVSATVRDRVLSHIDDIAVVSCRDPIKFKYGADAESGSILAVIGSGPEGLIGFRKSVPTYRQQPYPHGCVAEVFNASDYPYFEMELHGPGVRLAPGESFTLAEDAALFDLDEVPCEATAVRKYLAP